MSTQKEEPLNAAESAAMQRIAAAQHGIQSGVAVDLADGEKNLLAKHLRVGINSALVETGALGRLLVDKGIVTRLEYFERMAEAYEDERQRYEQRLTVRKGVRITLG
ncbi:MAG TPA: hypothetical protein VGG48_01730 [Rhizomicrobium sp.]|jgi:hypothetical protein